jgi:hypothetical protein
MAAFPGQWFVNSGFLVYPDFGVIPVPAGNLMELSCGITELMDFREERFWRSFKRVNERAEGIAFRSSRGQESL